jgi:hypothetical protein
MYAQYLSISCAIASSDDAFTVTGDVSMYLSVRSKSQLVNYGPVVTIIGINGQ